jgi:hypothetical protein
MESIRYFCLFAFVPVLIGAVIGAYMGGTIANEGQMNPGKWDYNSGRTWGYMAGGAIVGGLSGGIAAEIATSGIPFANTAAMAAGSFVNSVGTYAYTGGQTDISIALGAASYNFTQNEWGYLGRKGNSTLENIGYGFGALANIQDIAAGLNGTMADVKSRPKLAGHSETSGSYNGNDITISVGPADHSIGQGNGLKWEMAYVKRTLQGNSVAGENVSYIRPGDAQLTTRLNNVNGKWLRSMTQRLNAGQNLLNTGTLKYGLLYGCVNYNARALLFSGVLNVNAFLPVTAPVLLNAELALRQIGIYASPYLTTYR